MDSFFLQTPQPDSAPLDISTSTAQQASERVGRKEQYRVSSADESDQESSILEVEEDKEDDTTQNVLSMFLNILDSEVCVCVCVCVCTRLV